VLHRAADSGNVSICRLLLSRGADIGIIDLSGKTALHVAVESGNEDTVQAMLQDQDSNVRDTRGRTALFPAVENRDVSVVKLLIDHGVDVNLRDFKGEAPLHVAVEGGCEAMVQLVLENGAYSSI
jgi:ankyrin repeat protein